MFGQKTGTRRVRPHVPGTGVSGSARRARNRSRHAALRALAVCLAAALMLLGVLGSPASAATPPTAPGSFATSSVTSSSVTLTWTAATDDTGVMGYRVYRALGSGALTLITTTDAGVLKYVAGNLRSRTAYSFVVAALDADNNETRTAVKTATTTSSTDTTAPTAVSSSSVALTAFSSSRIDVVWAASSSSDVAYYEVLRGGTVVGTVESPFGTKYSDNGLTASTSYSYAVRAVDSAGNRSAATTAKSKTTLASGAVTIPRGPYALQVTGTSALIVWWSNIAATGSVTINGATVTDATSTTLHKVRVTGLKAGTQYAYTVKSGSTSSSGSLRAAAAPGTPFTLAVIGDFGGGSAQEGQNATRIAGFGSDVLQTVGDDVYPSAGLPDPNFATQYSDFDARLFKQFGAVFKTQAFSPANGNKEYYGAGEFWNAFPYPSPTGATANSYYSYDWGDAHITVLDPFRPYVSGSAQYTWAQNDLAAHQSAAWRIVIEHLPPYSSTNATSGNVGIKNALVPLFQAQHVDLVLSGDTHNYQRSKPLVNGAPVTSGGTTYVVTGGGGNGINGFTTTMPSWQAARYGNYESLKIQVSPTALQLTAVAASDGSVVDTATIAKPGADTAAPSVPTGLKAAPGSTSVALSWTASTDNVGVAKYNVYRNGTLVSSPTTTGYTDSGLTSGTTYSYTVSAVDAAGNQSAQTAAVTATTTGSSSDTAAPSAPTGLTATAGSSTSVALSWTASTDNVAVTGYNVLRNGTKIGTSSTTGYTDTTAVASTSYSYTVTAFDAAGNTSAASTAAVVTTPAASGGGSTVTLTPSNDRTIDPANTSPTTGRIKVDASSPQNDMLLKFTVPSSCARVTAAHLQLTVGTDTNDPSVKGGDFYATSQSDPFAAWSESSVVWNTAPAKTGNPVTLSGAVAANTMYDINVTSLVPAALGTFTIRGSNTSGDGAGYFSKEGSTTAGPKLILTCG